MWMTRTHETTNEKKEEELKRDWPIFLHLAELQVLDAAHVGCVAPVEFCCGSVEFCVVGGRHVVVD